jgi:hypothetical protein
MSTPVWPISFSWRLFAAFVLIFVALLLSSQLALAQFTQQGPKLVGNDAVGPSLEGWSVGPVQRYTWQAAGNSSYGPRQMAGTNSAVSVPRERNERFAVIRG